jgi:hypothetical protein
MPQFRHADRATALAVLVALCAVIVLSPADAAAQAPAAPGLSAAGVVTTLEGHVTAARAALPQPVALKFRDSVYLEDRITTAERSIARILLGGKAVVTVRERSTLTITELPGRAVIGLDAGKIGLAVAREKMRPGESIEIRTPNAVAGVRGTVVVVDVSRVVAQASTGPVPVRTTVSVLRGFVEAAFLGERGQFTPPVRVDANHIVAASGGVTQPPTPAVMTPTQASQATEGLQGSGPQLSGPANTQQLASQGLDQAARLADAVVPLLGQPVLTPTAVQSSSAANTCTGPSCVAQVVNGTPSTPEPLPPTPASAPVTALPPAVSGPSVLINGGFESNFGGWTLAGAGAIVDSQPFGVAVPEGSRLALIRTGQGSAPMSGQSPVDATIVNSQPVGSSPIRQGTALAQTFTASSVLLVSFQYSFLTNEYPTQTVNDFFEARLTDSAGAQTQLAYESRFSTAAAGKFETADQQVTVGGFTLNQGSGFTLAQTVSKTVVAADGPATLSFIVADVSDTSVTSAVLLDAVAVQQDPPRYFLRSGEQYVHPSSQPLYRLTNAGDAFDSLLVVCCGSSARVTGPLLEATDSTLDVPFSLVSVIQGGALTSTSEAPLVNLKGGRYTLGARVGIFDIAGVNVAADPETGKVVGTDTPLRHAGPLVSATGADVATRQAVKVDTALLEATMPLVQLLAGSHLRSEADAVTLSYKAKVTSLGPLVRLDRSALTVANGALVNVAGGSLLRVNGDLVHLTNGSALSLLNGALLNVTGGSFANISGALVSFGGSGGNRVSITNSLCPCTLVGGIPVALTGGAGAGNVSIGANAIKNANLGAVTLSNPTLGPGGTALAVVNGSGSRLSVGH